jgi:hypothetical protein
VSHHAYNEKVAGKHRLSLSSTFSPNVQPHLEKACTIGHQTTRRYHDANAFREGRLSFQSNLLIWNSASDPTHDSTRCPPKAERDLCFSLALRIYALGGSLIVVAHESQYQSLVTRYQGVRRETGGMVHGCYYLLMMLARFPPLWLVCRRGQPCQLLSRTLGRVGTGQACCNRRTLYC